MRMFLRGSSSRDPKDDGSEKKPKYLVPRVAEVRACEWPSDVFLRAAGIYEDFYHYLVENAGLTAFVEEMSVRNTSSSLISSYKALTSI